MQALAFSRCFLSAARCGSGGDLLFVTPPAAADGAAESFPSVFGTGNGDQSATFGAAELKHRLYRVALVGMFPVGFLTFLTAEPHAEIFVISDLHQLFAFPAMKFADDGAVFCDGSRRLFSLVIGFALASGRAVFLPGTLGSEFLATNDTFHDASLLRFMNFLLAWGVFYAVSKVPPHYAHLSRPPRCRILSFGICFWKKIAYRKG